MSRLVVSEILNQPCNTTRVQAIEKWTAVADICRCLHNFNGVLQICAAFTNSAVYRLKNTWTRVSKSVSIFYFCQQYTNNGRYTKNCKSYQNISNGKEGGRNF